MYDYRKETAENIRQYLQENWNYIPEEKKENREVLEQYLNDELRIEDSITGNGSGSFTFNREKARENLEGNNELIEETINEFCIDMGKHWNDYEYLDVSVRCYILGECINEVLENCTRKCDTCGKMMIEGFICEDSGGYYCSKNCLKESLVEDETIEDLKLGEDESTNYWTSWIESL